jgi:inorganic pyrophosphatase
MGNELETLVSRMLQAHPWHGVAPGPELPARVTAFIEIVPTDVVKYELDKASGLLKIDRPQRFSSVCPSMYGFIPQTYCGPKVAARCAHLSGGAAVRGDGDPLDICVLSEKSIPKGGFLLQARAIGGLRMLDGGEADDKIIAVLEGDLSYGSFTDLDQCPSALIDRLRHYFLSYKQLPDEPPRARIAEVYGREEAFAVIGESVADYRDAYGDPGERAQRLLALMRG